MRRKKQAAAPAEGDLRARIEELESQLSAQGETLASMSRDLQEAQQELLEHFASSLRGRVASLVGEAMASQAGGDQ